MIGLFLLKSSRELTPFFEAVEKVNFLCYTPKSLRGDLLIIRGFHTPLGGQGVSKRTFSTGDGGEFV